MGRQRTRTDLETKFGKRVRTERENREWSQKELADQMNRMQDPVAGTRTHVTTVAKIEAGDRTVRLDEAVTLAKVFEVSLDWMLGTEQEHDLAYALDRLTAAAQRSGVDAEKIAAALQTAEQDVTRHYDPEALRSVVRDGITDDVKDMNLGNLRAMAMLLTSERGREALTRGIADTTMVVALRHADRTQLVAQLDTLRIPDQETTT
jgi:transcriptional regulator with XRE-family HTH domain